LADACRRHGVLAVYLFGSRKDDGARLLRGEAVEDAGSDLDVGIVFEPPPPDHRRLAAVQVALEEVFAPLRVDLVPLQRVDPLFQFAAVDGHRVAALDRHRADLFELYVMRRAAEALPMQRQHEMERFGITTR
jgi:predicted nucleotidyltransferase